MLYPGTGKPLFSQLKDVLIQKIRQGDYKEGSKLPSERAISEQYQVSRVTVRLALEVLVSDGLIIKKQGKGNFVAYKKIEHHLDGLLGFVEEFATRQLKCTVELIKKEFIIPSQEIAVFMQQSKNQKMFLVIRKIIVDGEALGLDYTYVPLSVAVVLESLDFNVDIVYRHLEKNGFKLSTANQTITAKMPNNFETELLKLGPNIPLLEINRIAYTKGDLPLVFSRTVYNSERYQYQLELKRYPQFQGLSLKEV